MLVVSSALSAVAMLAVASALCALSGSAAFRSVPFVDGLMTMRFRDGYTCVGNGAHMCAAMGTIFCQLDPAAANRSLPLEDHTPNCWRTLDELDHAGRARLQELEGSHVFTIDGTFDCRSAAPSASVPIEAATAVEACALTFVIQTRPSEWYAAVGARE
jgi:hypothetical protein